MQLKILIGLNSVLPTSVKNTMHILLMLLSGRHGIMYVPESKMLLDRHTITLCNETMTHDIPSLASMVIE